MTGCRINMLTVGYTVSPLRKQHKTSEPALHPSEQAAPTKPPFELNMSNRKKIEQFILEYYAASAFDSPVFFC